MRTRIADIRAISSCLTAVLLAGCGGGAEAPLSTMPLSGSPAPASSALPAAAPFPLSTSLAALSAHGLAAGLNLSGSYQGVSASGSGSFVESAAAPAVFEGQPALHQGIALNATITAGGIVSVSSSTMADEFTNSSHQMVGLTYPGEYDVATSPLSYPATVVVGQTGSLGTMNRYTDATKSTLLGTIAVTYGVQPDTAANTAVFDEIAQVLDLNNNVTDTIHLEYRITAAGGISLAGASITNSKYNVTATAL